MADREPPAAESAERVAARMGLWIFLASEILIFAALFLCLIVVRELAPLAFRNGTRHMDLALGTINTALLLTSSWLLASGLEQLTKATNRVPWRRLIATAVLGVTFLLIKGFEYRAHAAEGLFPGLAWRPDPVEPPSLLLFMFLYFFTTLLHALHLAFGVCLIGALLWQLRNPGWRRDHAAWIENVGLYWHFVDVVWIFLFPLLYLIGRNG